MECYLDNAATTRVSGEAVRIMEEVMEKDYGNPSSLHKMGFEAEKHLKHSREVFSSILKCKSKEIIFTSGGTESNNTAIIGTATAKGSRGKHIITTRIEHPAVSQAMKFLEGQGFDISYLSVDGEGLINIDELSELVREDTILVSIMHVNNEIGSIEPVYEAGCAIHEKNPDCLFHVDDIQGFGKLSLIPKKGHIDMLSASSHKLHGPKGTGLLYMSERTHISPVLFGGGQMEGRRSGTENVPGIAGFAEAAKLAYDGLPEKYERMRRLRAGFVEGLLKLPDTLVNGPDEPERISPHIVSASFKDVRAEVLLHALEDKGVYISAGSACSSNHKQRSAVLQAIGVKDWAYESTVRFSFSHDTKEEETEYTLKVLNELIPQLKKFTRR